MESLSRIANTLWLIVGNLGDLAVELWQLGASWALVLLWIVWWLAAVNWTKLWPVLGKGAWAALSLLCVLVALAWSRIAPADCSCGLPSFWWQLGATVGLVLLAFLCGWVQGLLHWAPAEINLNPPVHGHGHDHGHGHGGHDHH
jgi:hypothetical protein